MWVIFFLVCVNFIFDCYGLYSFINVKTNFVSFNLFVLIETFLLFIFYRTILTNINIKQVLIVIISLFFAFWLYEFFTKGQQSFVWHCVTVENIFILVFAIYYYYEKIFLLNKAFIYTNPRFWIVTAYFINTAGTFFLMLYIPALNATGQLKFYALNYAVIIIRNILLAVAMSMGNNNQKEKFQLT